MAANSNPDYLLFAQYSLEMLSLLVCIISLKEAIVLSSVLSRKTCAACRFCCVFSKGSEWEVPFSVQLGSSECPDGSGRPCENLDPLHGCRLGEARPIECHMWPLRIMDCGGIPSLVLCTSCSAYNENFSLKVKKLLCAGLRTKIQKIVAVRPEMIRPFHSGYEILGPLFDNTSTLC